MAHARRRAIALGAFVVGAALSGGPANAMVRYGFDQRYFFDPGATLADHSFTTRNGVWHLFYTRGPAWSSSSGLQDSIGHATTTDFLHWTIQPPVLAVTPGAWDENAHWAPELLKLSESVFCLYFTGVTDAFTQQIGLATSGDLFTWTPSTANPVFRPDTSWADWTSDAWSDCRDPFMLRQGPLYYMFATARTNDGRGAIAAASSSDLVHWTDEGPIYSLDPGPLSWHAIESSVVLEHGGGYAMLFGETDVQGVSSMTSPSLLTGWSSATRTLVDLGSAPCVFTDPTSGLDMYSRHASATISDTLRTFIKIDSLEWNGLQPMVVMDRPMGSWTTSGDAFLYQPTFLDARAGARGVAVGQVGNGWIGTAERWQGPLQLGSAGSVAGDVPTGEARSPTFTVSGDSLSLLVAGGNLPDSLTVQLCDACTDQPIHSATGTNDDRLTRRVWSLAGWKGQSAYLKILDKASGPWGHIGVDEIAEFLAPGGDSVVQQPAVVTMLGPAPRVLLEIDDTTTVRWRLENAGGIDSVAIFVSRDASRTFERIGGAGPADTSFAWQITGPPTDSARVKVVAYRGLSPSGCAQTGGDLFVWQTAIQNVRVVNLAGTSAVVTWTTTVPEDGAVDFGTQTLDRTTIESGSSFQVHWVTLSSLTPTTTYKFRVRSGGATDDNGGLLYTFRTATGNQGSSYVLKGSVTGSGVPGARTLVLVWLRRAGVQSTPVGMLTTAGANWSVNLAAARDPVNGTPFGAVVGDTALISMIARPDLAGQMTAIINGNPPQNTSPGSLVTGVEEPPRPAASAVLRLGAPRPLPARAGEAVVLPVSADAAGPLEAAVLDAEGRLVRTLSAPPSGPGGTFDLVWDGRDTAGRRVSAGVYLLAVRAGGVVATRRAVVIR